MCGGANTFVRRFLQKGFEPSEMSPTTCLPRVADANWWPLNTFDLFCDFFRFCRSILVDGSAQRDPDAEEPPARSLEPTAQWMWVLSIFYFVCFYLDCWCRKNNIFERSAVFHCGHSYFDQYRAVSGAPQRETTPTNKNWPFLGGQK